MKPTIADRIGHIATAIGNIQRITAGQTRESFTNDLTMRLAIERLLEIISEASRFLPPEVKIRESGVNWRRLSDLGNWLRHAYHRTDAALLWAMIEDDLEPLRIFIDRIAKESNR